MRISRNGRNEAIATESLEQILGAAGCLSAGVGDADDEEALRSIGMGRFRSQRTQKLSNSPQEAAKATLVRKSAWRFTRRAWQMLQKSPKILFLPNIRRGCNASRFFWPSNKRSQKSSVRQRMAANQAMHQLVSSQGPVTT